MSVSLERLTALREELSQRNLDGFLIPQSDEHQGEYIAPYAQRLAWLSGFTGSAGSALILKDKAIIFVDGRYSLQVRAQTDNNLYDYEDLISCPPSVWLKKNGANLRIGFDPFLHVSNEVKALREALACHSGSELVPTPNLVDEIWSDQPARPLNPFYFHPLAYNGRKSEEKLKDIQAALGNQEADFTILTDPSSIAWLLNIRGSDVEHTPLVLGFAIVLRQGNVLFFIDEQKIPEDLRAILGPLCSFYPREELLPCLRKLASEGLTALLDPQLCAYQFEHTISEAGGKFVYGMDPCRLPRAIKNKTELEGARKAHLWDGVAVTKFLYWVINEKPEGLTEIGASDRLACFRQDVAVQFGSKCEDLSFSTIAGAGEHGAIIHYKATPESNRLVKDGEIFLVDSGGQYKEGTTDITRTVAIGEVTDSEIKRLYTLVLKGVINLSLAHFVEGTRGCDLDVLARIALWNAGFNYAHGTGHGVGSYLSVHEGPQNISSRGSFPLHAGMILSNEPGYYRDGAFGIRLENLIMVKEKALVPGGELEMLSFETLTYVPFDPRLIDGSLLTSAELAWLNRYHQECYDRLSPHLTEIEASWLAEITRPLSQSFNV